MVIAVVVLMIVVCRRARGFASSIFGLIVKANECSDRC